jgi:ABC-type phosphate transport system permease subunit
MGLGVVLFAITIAVNMVARAVVDRAERRLAGTA